MGRRPARSASILSATLSTHTTSLPRSAKTAPVTSPTYPAPTTQMFIGGSYYQRSFARPPGGSSGAVGQREQGVEEHVRAALDRRRVAHLVDPMAPAALGRNEDHPGVADPGEVLRVVAGRRVEAAGREAELCARLLDRRLHP